MLIVLIVPGIAMADYSQDLIPTMTSNNTPSGIASESSSFGPLGAYGAWRAMDDNNPVNDTAYYCSTSPACWLAYEFAEQKKIERYTITTMNWSGYGARAPKNWTFEGWNGSDWIVLDTVTDQTSWGTAEKRTYDFDNENYYIKYRINIIANNGNAYTSIGQMEMMGELASDPSAPANLSATAGNAQVSLTWDAVTDATGYNVKRATTTGGHIQLSQKA